MLLSRSINILSDLPVARKCDLTYKSGAATRIKLKGFCLRETIPSIQNVVLHRVNRKPGRIGWPFGYRTCRDWGWNLARDRLSFVTAVLLAVFDISPIHHFQEEGETIRGMKQKQETRSHTKSFYFRLRRVFYLSIYLFLVCRPESRMKSTQSVCVFGFLSL